MPILFKCVNAQMCLYWHKCLCDALFLLNVKQKIAKFLKLKLWHTKLQMLGMVLELKMDSAKWSYESEIKFINEASRYVGNLAR